MPPPTWSFVKPRPRPAEGAERSAPPPLVPGPSDQEKPRQKTLGRPPTPAELRATYLDWLAHQERRQAEPQDAHPQEEVNVLLGGTVQASQTSSSPSREPRPALSGIQNLDLSTQRPAGSAPLPIPTTPVPGATVAAFPGIDRVVGPPADPAPTLLSGPADPGQVVSGLGLFAQHDAVLELRAVYHDGGACGGFFDPHHLQEMAGEALL